MKTTILGGGSWGTALARELGNKGEDITHYIRRQEQIDDILKNHENTRYLKGVKLPENIKYESDLEKSIENSDVIVFAVPTNSVRKVCEELEGKVSEDVILVNVAKGIEQNTLKRISEIIGEFFPKNRFVVLSGPSHAEEVGLDYPTTIVSASLDLEAAKVIQDLFMTDTLRIYINEDLIGVELAGALKNVIALGNGIIVGRGFGDNTTAALMTRGMAEITRLGTAMGANPTTFLGLAGMGDLIVTCGSTHSRNRTCGELIGKGYSIDEAIEKVGMVVEGIKTTHAVNKLSKDYNVDMPISNTLYKILYDDLAIEDAVNILMNRKKKHEIDSNIRG